MQLPKEIKEVTSQQRLLENKKTIHEGVTLFMISTGVLDLMYNKVFNNLDTLSLLGIDKTHLDIRNTLSDNSYIDNIANNQIDMDNFTEILNSIVENNKRLAKLLANTQTKG